MKRFIIALLFICASLTIKTPAFATDIYKNDFNNHSAGALSLGSNWKIMSSGGVNSSPALRLTYATKGTSGNQATLNVEQYKTQELWLEFDARIEGSMNGGMKFVKIFGSKNTHSQNNNTLGMDYYSNSMKELSYYGDTICSARYNGTPGYKASCVSTPVKTTDSIDLRGNVWRRVKIHFVRATPGTNTGSARIWVDGVEKVYIKNINNNSPIESATSSIAYITFGDYTHSNTSTWHFWVDNLSVSTRDGEGTIPPPSTPPTNEPLQPPKNFKTVQGE